MKKIVCLTVVVCLVLVLAACSSSPVADDPVLVNNIQHRVIIDCDALGDDATAVSLCAKASNIILEGVAVVAGSVDIEQAADNILMTLEMDGRADVPVYCGSETTLTGEKKECYSIFGEDGMGDADLIHPTGEAQEQFAVDFILETVNKYPYEIEILEIGPATNVALAILKDPDTMRKVKRIWVMGTSGFGEGNATPVAEYNVYNDTPAYEVMMNSSIPVTVVGLDMCEKENLLYYPQDMAVLASSSELGNYHVTSWNKLYEYKSTMQGSNFCDVCDSVAASALIWDNFVKSSQMSASAVCADEGPSYGQVIFYKEGYTYDSMPVVTGYDKDVVTSVCEYRFKDAVKKLLAD